MKAMRREVRIQLSSVALLCAAGFLLLHRPGFAQPDKEDAQLTRADWITHGVEVRHAYIDSNNKLQYWVSRKYPAKVQPSGFPNNHARTSAGGFIPHWHHYMEFGTAEQGVLPEISLPPNADRVDIFWDAMFIAGNTGVHRVSGKGAKAQHQTCWEAALETSTHAGGVYKYELYVDEDGTPDYARGTLEADLKPVISEDGETYTTNAHVVKHDILDYTPLGTPHVSLVVDIRLLESSGDELPDDGDEGDELPDEGEGSGDEIPSDGDEIPPPAAPSKIQWKWLSSGIYSYDSPSGPSNSPVNSLNPYRTPYKAPSVAPIPGMTLSQLGLVEHELHWAIVWTKKGSSESPIN